MAEQSVSNPKDDFIIVECPTCGGTILIYKNELNCRIFRHAVYKNNLQNINPHASKVECDKLVQENRIHGCARPFQVTISNNIFTAVLCDYI
jgi:hypothetical protein